MSDAIASHGYNVESSDLFDRGYGDAGVDFLKSDKTADNIITNPPFHSAEEFVAAAREKATKKYAFLLRLAFLESANRQKTIFLDNPPSKIWVFSERITFYPRGAVRKGSGTTAYAWFVWDQENDGPTELSWLPTGYKSGSKSKPSSGLLL
ncbi:hypothetical protein [Falsihalocynthiibacter arcticus]|nr:hypothetical protein [Falsihalocynthiibacter arcticus]